MMIARFLSKAQRHALKTPPQWILPKTNTRHSNSYYSKIPNPTWSIEDLDLTFQKDKPKEITDDELEHLAQKSLIQIHSLDPKERSELKLQLSKIMKCISLVTEMSDSSDKSNHLKDESHMYDTPRGFEGDDFYTPVRIEQDEINTWKEFSQKESQTILNTLKEDKMVTYHGNSYFCLSVEKKEDGL